MITDVFTIFDPILVPTWLHFGTQNPPKSIQKSIPRCIKKMMHFCIDFLIIVAPTGDPSWGHVGHFFAQGGGTGKNATLFFVALVFSFDFFAPRTDGVPHFGPPSGLDFGGFWSNFGSMLGPTWRYLGALGHKRWHWTGWWGYAKRKELPYWNSSGGN